MELAKIESTELTLFWNMLMARIARKTFSEMFTSSSDLEIYIKRSFIHAHTK